MSTFQQEVIRLNNDGVHSLGDNDGVYAAQLFTEAIHLVKCELLRTSPNNAKGQVAGSAKHATATFIQLLRKQEGMLHTTEIPFPFAVSPSVGGAEDGELVFNRAITIDLLTDGGCFTATSTSATQVQPLEQQQEDHQNCIHLLSTVLTYNLALANHLMATSVFSRYAADTIDREETHQQFIQRAERLYELALKLASGNTDILNKLNINLLLKLACLNNLAQIRFSRADYSSRQDLAAHISSIFMVGRLEQEEDSSSSAYAAEESREEETRLQRYENDPVLKGLLLNSLFLLHNGARSPQVAPAA